MSKSDSKKNDLWKRLTTSAAIAGAVLCPTAASASKTTANLNPLEQRVFAVRRAFDEQRHDKTPATAAVPADDEKPIKLAQWMNWGNWGNWNNWLKWNDWNNWNDWHNWHDWSNWGKFSNY